MAAQIFLYFHSFFYNFLPSFAFLFIVFPCCCAASWCCLLLVLRHKVMKLVCCESHLIGRELNGGWGWQVQKGERQFMKRTKRREWKSFAMWNRIGGVSVENKKGECVSWNLLIWIVIDISFKFIYRESCFK